MIRQFTNCGSKPTIFLVPQCFVDNNNQDGRCDSTIPMLNTLGHYCLKKENCRKILHFLTLSGKHNIRANAQIMYQDTMIFYGNIYVESFDQIVDEVLYKIFQKRFQNKATYMENTTFVGTFGSKNIDDSGLYKRIERVKSITTEEDCFNDGPDCMTAILILDGTLNKLYRILTVLNKDNSDDNRNYGTLTANVISELDPDGQISLNKKKEMLVVFSKIQMELQNLFHQIIPASDLPLISFLELLGYSDDFFLNIDSNSTSSEKEFAGKCLAESSMEDQGATDFSIKESDNLMSNLESLPCNFDSLTKFWSIPKLKSLYDEATKEQGSGEGRMLGIKNYNFSKTIT